MPNDRNLGFTLLIRRGRICLGLSRNLKDARAAAVAALEFAEIRVVGLEGMVIRCETTGEEWAADDLIASLAMPLSRAHLAVGPN